MAKEYADIIQRTSFRVPTTSVSTTTSRHTPAELADRLEMTEGEVISAARSTGVPI
jgi:hypothetical protein